MAGQPTGTVTMLFTDIEGSTRLLQRLGRDRYAEALDLHRRLLRGASAQHQGYEVNCEGDAFFFAFARAQDAVAAAAAAQQALADADWPEAGRLLVRIGIHTGEPLAAPPKYVGLDVHKAARIAAAAHGGQILVSQTTRDLLEPTVALRDLGEHRLKDLPERQRLHQLLIQGLPQEFPLLTTLDAGRASLPISPNALIGRERELAEVASLLRDDATRLVTLTGPGGTGKTRLALQVAADLEATFPDGVFFVGLAAVVDPALVLSEIGQALGIRETAGDPLAQTLELALRGREQLIVLDNLEQVIDAAPAIGELLTAAGPKVLATSRAPLRLSAEREYRVPPLTEEAAIVLFAERGRAARPDFRLTAENEPAVAEICARLDRLPLALELAAARVKLLSPERLRDRVQSRLELLTAGPRDLPARQQTLRSAISWSYGLLEEADRLLFGRLAVFVSGCALEAAESICDASLDDLASLVDQSLLLRAPAERLTMLATIHEYALERLEASGEAHELRLRHARWFVHLAEEASEALTGAGQQEWLERLDLEHDNLRAALDRALELRETELALRLVAALWRFWLLHGHLSEGRAAVERALALEGQHPRLRANALRGAAALAATQGDDALSRAFSEESVELYRELGDAAGLARALSNLGNACAAGGEAERAAGLYQESIELLQDLGEDWGVAVATLNLGLLAVSHGDCERAHALCGESLARFRTLGDKEGVVHSLVTLGFASLGLGSVEQAGVQLGEGLSVACDLGDLADVAESLDGLAAVAAASGDAIRAARLVGAAEAVRGQVGAVREVSYEAFHEHTVAEVSRILGAHDFETARAKGRGLTLADAIEISGVPVPTGA
jgi:predicted ATPase/class 3 adenylate cyclase